eukprot:6181475-Pleurochrysis_carterae.AAC.3
MLCRKPPKLGHSNTLATSVQLATRPWRQLSVAQKWRNRASKPFQSYYSWLSSFRELATIVGYYSWLL